MKKTTIATITLFVLISLAALLSILWVVDFSHLNIPELIPVLQVRTYGILILIAFIVIFFFFQKRLINFNTETSVFKLIVASTVMAFISLLFYQGIRQLIILRGQYSYDLSSVLLSSAVPTILLFLVSASVALELKKAKGIWKHIPTLISVILLILIKQNSYHFEW
jgi:hypothetical protein